MASTFADRLWWARHRAHLGATKLARMVGCAQSLISSLERANAEKSKLNDKFAKALKVDPHWLAFGVEGRAPDGFDEDAARRGRVKGDRSNVVSLEEPRWSEPTVPGLSREDQLHTTLIGVFQDYLNEVGPDLATSAIEILKQMAAFEQAKRQKQSGASD